MVNEFVLSLVLVESMESGDLTSSRRWEGIREVTFPMGECDLLALSPQNDQGVIGIYKA